MTSVTMSLPGIVMEFRMGRRTMKRTIIAVSLLLAAGLLTGCSKGSASGEDSGIARESRPVVEDSTQLAETRRDEIMRLNNINFFRDRLIKFSCGTAFSPFEPCPNTTLLVFVDVGIPDDEKYATIPTKDKLVGLLAQAEFQQSLFKLVSMSTATTDLMGVVRYKSRFQVELPISGTQRLVDNFQNCLGLIRDKERQGLQSATYPENDPRGVEDKQLVEKVEKTKNDDVQWFQQRFPDGTMSDKDHAACQARENSEHP